MIAAHNSDDLFYGIDIGGTAIKAGLFDAHGTLFEQKSIPTPELTSAPAFQVLCDALAELVTSRSRNITDIRGIGLDMPAPIADDGSVGFVPNAKIDLPKLTDALKAFFAQASIVVLNDANAAALGEQWMGAGRGESSMVMVTLGTGVGGGVVCNGKLVSGKHGTGGEIGHILVNPSETHACGCGRFGCLEQYASAKGVVNSYRALCEQRNQQSVSLSGPSDSLAVFTAAQAGDSCAREAISRMCDYLARVLSYISCISDPALFVIGGGMAAGFDQFSAELCNRYEHYTLTPCKQTRIVPAQLGNRAGIYGSAYQALLRAQAELAGASCTPV